MGCPHSKFDVSSGSAAAQVHPVYRVNPAFQDDSARDGPTRVPTKLSPDVFAAVDQGGVLETRATLPNPQLQNEDANAIAIVGMGCRSPGADNLREYWRLLLNGENHVSDVPADRWNRDAFLDQDGAGAGGVAHGKAYVQKGGFIKDVTSFDNALYGINDYEASQMDPQQALLLECTSMALEDAGITRAGLSGSNTGVFVGAMNTDHRSGSLGVNTRTGNYTAAGTSSSVLSGRMSYVFNLLGPSMTLDTACSASLIAIHQACLAIRSGDCDMAVCGGVNTMTLPDVYVHLSKARMISPTGQCHTFSDKADGYTRGEGCGVVILKRLDHALRDGDKVWATVCTGTNQDGRTVTPMTAPSGEQQEKLLHAVYGKFNVDVNQLHYIEAHGTGTPAGDPVEVNALGSFFKQRGVPRERYLGSVKTNIGHTESAAAVLSVIKVCLMMHHDLIVPSLHCQVVNPKIDLSDLRFIIPKETVPWHGSEKLAGCNAFGFGGSNCHAVLRSHSKGDGGRVGGGGGVVVGVGGGGGGKSDGEEEEEEGGACIVCFSGKTRKSLKGSLQDCVGGGAGAGEDGWQEEGRVRDVAFTSTTRRDHYAHRAAFLVRDTHDLHGAVTQHLARDAWTPPAHRQPRVVFVFCGMGTAWKGMCRELLAKHPVFRDAVEEVDRLLSVNHGVAWSLVDKLLNEDVSRDPLVSPLALFACQVGLAAAWRSVGVHPACVVGQSVGEVAAAYVAGGLDLQDAVSVAFQRSQLLAQVQGGAMLVVLHVPVKEVRDALKEDVEGDASVSLHYSDRACAVSAASDVMPRVKRQLLTRLSPAHRDMQVKDLDVTVAYHSPHVNHCADKLGKLVRGINAHLPKVPMLSSVTGTLLTAAPQAGYWVDNLRNPVLFSQAVTAAAESKASLPTVFLEIGPKPVLKAHLKDIFPGKLIPAVPSMFKKQEMEVFLKALITLYEEGAEIEWAALPGNTGEITDVPRYVFDKVPYSERTETQLVLASAADFFNKTHLFTYMLWDTPDSYAIMISPLIIPSIYDHVLSNTILVPGAFMVEVVLAIARYQKMVHPEVSIRFEHAASLKRGEVTDMTARLIASTGDSDSGLASVVLQHKGRQLATMEMKESGQRTQPVVNLDHLKTRCKHAVSKDDIYSTLRRFGFEYGPSYSLLQHAGKAKSECLAFLETTKALQKEMVSTIFHPSILDSALQASFLAADDDGKSDETRLPKSIGQIVVHGPMETSMYVHTRLVKSGANESVFDQQIISPSGLVLAEIKDSVIQVLRTHTGETVPSLPTSTWTKLTDMAALNKTRSALDAGNSSFLFVTNNADVTHNGTHVTIKVTEDPEVTDVTARIREALSGQRVVSALVFLFSADAQDNADGDAIHKQVLHACLLTQAILQTLNEVSPDTPFFLCTYNAWPATAADGGFTTTTKPAANVDQTATHPSATALWGMLRTVVMERVYSRVTALELHLPPTQGNKNLPSLLAKLMADDNLREYPELLVTADGVFAGLVVKNESSSLAEQIISANTTSQSLRGVEKGGAGMPLPFELKSSAKNTENLTWVKIESFGHNTGGLLRQRMAAGSETCGTGGQHMTFATEMKGQLMDGSETEVASCCPVLVKPEVFVPTETVVLTSRIPDYWLGDVSKLAVLWELRCSVQTESVSILTSTATQPLAEIVQLMCSSPVNGTTPTVNIVLLQDLEKAAEFGATLMSLVFIDDNVMGAVMQKAGGTARLVTCSSLVSPDALSLMSCTLPGVDLLQLDVQFVFRPVNLKKTVPQLNLWMEQNRPQMTQAAKSLHRDAAEIHAADLNTLLRLNKPAPSVHTDALRAGTRFKKNASYMVVGGLTGLGWICVEFLAENNAGFIAIVNRRCATEEQREAIANLSQKLGCQIQTYSADITDMSSLKLAFRQISLDAGGEGSVGLRGVFLGAAVLDDSSFPAMTREAFDKVMAPKVKGAWNVHQLTKGLALDHFVLHSSIVSVLGNPGQANYAAGNAFLDGLAAMRRQAGLAAQTVNWGPLDTGLLQGQGALQTKMAAGGLHVASSADVTHALRVVLALGQTQSVPARLDPKLYARKLYASTQQAQPLVLRFQKFASPLSADSHSLATTSSATDMARVRHLAPEERLSAYEAYVRGLVSQVLVMEVTQVSLHLSLQELGMDSLAGTMMLDRIQRDTTFKIPPVEIFAGETTVAALAGKLSEYTGRSLL